MPGETPHPTRDPRGHSYGIHPDTLASFNAEDWARCSEYLYGIDLFNHGYWWEAHEALEAVWVAAGRHTEAGSFVQGLIQIAAAELKWFQGYFRPAERLAAKGLEKISRRSGIYLGVDVAKFHAEVKVRFVSPRDTACVIRLIVPPKTQSGTN